MGTVATVGRSRPYTCGECLHCLVKYIYARKRIMCRQQPIQNDVNGYREIFKKDWACEKFVKA